MQIPKENLHQHFGLDCLLTSLLNMETGVRGYAITGADKFLEPFNTGKADFELHFKEIKRLVSENQEQCETRQTGAISAEA